ncbi:hypothetical protein GCM10009682_27610 [Luedemannella flava]|uniref:Uncharacterized protein n=1 Tax=Luedemannella flava TaxID=349316 RepID=A0ABN2M025_9ACTN
MVAVLAVGVLFVAGCTGEPGRPAVGATGPGWVGGLRTPSPVPVDINPSAPPVGDTVPTGVVVDGRELVLYVWHSVQVPWLGAAALDRGTGGLTDWLIGTGRSFNGTGEPGHFGEVRREEVPDGTVIYMGMFRGTVDRIVLAEPDGGSAEAAFTAWSAGDYTIFWARCRAAPIPENTPVGEGRTEPLDPVKYPLVSAFDKSGAALDEVRLRPAATKPRVV